jgi:hypothetical protein
MSDGDILQPRGVLQQDVPIELEYPNLDAKET